MSTSIPQPKAIHLILRIVGFIFAVLVGVTIILGLFFYMITENYFPLYPHIDTHFAEDFSIAGFSQIQEGMTESEVDAILGSPLNKSRYAGTDFDALWIYSQDGAAPIGDFAWEQYGISFQNGIVTSTWSSWVHD